MTTFHELPLGWQWTNISKIVKTLKSGLSRKLSQADIGLPVLRSTNITENGIDISDIKYWYQNDPQGSNTADYFLQDGDILVNFINSIAQIGKSALYKNELKRNTIYTTNILRLQTNNKIIPEYFLALTKTQEFGYYIQSITKLAVNQASFTTKDFRDFRFPLPPLPEQRKIAEILSTWDEAIEKTEGLIAALEARKKGLMQRLLTGQVRFPGFDKEWISIRLDERIEQFIVPMRDKPKVFRGRIPWCRIEDFNGIYLKRSKSGQCVDEQTIKEMNLRVYPVGTVLCSCSADLGRCAITAAPLVTNQTFIGLVPQNDLNRLFLYYYLSFNYHQLQRLSSGTTIAYLSREQFEKYKIRIPQTIEEQGKIAEILYVCDQEIELTNKYLNQLTIQKQGLMQNLLTGKIRVLNDN